jgi:hypothetical protein
MFCGSDSTSCDLLTAARAIKEGSADTINPAVVYFRNERLLSFLQCLLVIYEKSFA